MTRSVARGVVAAIAGAWLVVLPASRAVAVDAAPSSGAAVSPKGTLRIGVAAFERRGAEGADVPDIAQQLADRLAADPRADSVGPATLGSGPSEAAGSEALLAWAEPQGLDAVARGQVTQLGRSTSIDVRLWSGMTGAVLGTYVEEAPVPGALPEVIERLAGRLLEAVAGPDVAAAPPVAVAAAAPSEVAADAPEPQPKRPADRGGLDSSKPLRIDAQELEAIEGAGGARTIHFRGAVRVEQDDVELRSDTLEAFYPAGASEPQRFVATGDVHLRQATRHLSCDRADFEQAGQKLVCVGNAELREGEDRVRGKQIEIFFDSSRIVVKGGARLNINQAESSP